MRSGKSSSADLTCSRRSDSGNGRRTHHRFSCSVLLAPSQLSERLEQASIVLTLMFIFADSIIERDCSLPTSGYLRDCSEGKLSYDIILFCICEAFLPAILYHQAEFKLGKRLNMWLFTNEPSFLSYPWDRNIS